MKQYYLLITIFLSSCVSINNEEKFIDNFDFNKSMTFEEISFELKQYTKNSKYPNIDD